MTASSVDANSLDSGVPSATICDPPATKVGMPIVPPNSEYVAERSETCADDDDRDQGAHTLTRRTQITHEAGVRLLIQLLGGGTGRHQAMETGESPACNRHEKQRQQGRRSIGNGPVVHRCDDLRICKEHGAEQQGQPNDELNTVDEVSRLKQ